jgi:alpha/beta superfamily hydrolase
MKLTFKSGAVDLEGDLFVPSNCTRAAVVCHPHPQYGGDMNNAVVCAIAGVLRQAGYATLRFNFRGVGASTGVYGGGVGEIEDARNAVRYLRERSGGAAITLAGYSFGALVGLQAGMSMEEVDRLIAVAPPLAFADLTFLSQCEKGKLFIVGDCDQFCSLTELREALVRIAGPNTLRIVPGADHFFAGHERGVADAVRPFLQYTRQAGNHSVK